MCVAESCEDGLSENRLTKSQPATADAAPPLLPRFIKAEANLLRLPLFALHTKGLKTLDGIECRGTRADPDGHTYEFMLRATRNTGWLYPGPLSRSAHQAFLSVGSDKGFPIENPITWTWRDLCRRMDIAYSGTMVHKLKRAIESTKYLAIHTRNAIYSKAENRMIETREDSLQLYDRVVFVGAEMPNGTRADANYLWLADWYLQNLNAMFAAPLDYNLWRWLDHRSPIASRLYEFLIIIFRKSSLLRINYPNLAQFLPVRPERYDSLARRQLGPALDLLRQVHAVADVSWCKSKTGLPQLHIHRGSLLTPPENRTQFAAAFTEQDFTSALHLKELRGLKSAEWHLVADFYWLWSGEERHRPTQHELAQAREIVQQNGQTKAELLIPLVVKRMKLKFPDAKTFGAITHYVRDVAADYDREQRRIDRQRAEQLQHRREDEEAARKQAEHEKLIATWRPYWEQLPEQQKAEIRKATKGDSHHMRRTPELAERLCILEFAGRRASATQQVS